MLKKLLNIILQHRLEEEDSRDGGRRSSLKPLCLQETSIVRLGAAHVLPPL